ncbi:MAG: SDR family oxidoreductase [Planctomycetes bacterium]|nr:SDR family oxidoreductase [Planctomycetota bacterium]
MNGIFRDDLFKDKSVLVTGGGSGIGREIALAFARLGASVTIGGRKVEKLAAVEKELREITDGVLTFSADIRDVEAVEKMFGAHGEKFGSLDFLVNNAGGQFPMPAMHFNKKGFEAVISTNLTGTFFVSQTAANKFFIPQNRGSIVSIVACVRRGFPGLAHTGAARAGVINLTMSLAVEWARFGIRVNSVAPGTIESSGLAIYPPEVLQKAKDANLMHRFGAMEEIANAVIYLSSPAAAYITGETLYVDGGQSLYGDIWEA